VSNDERLYRTVGMLLAAVPSMAVIVLLVVSLRLGAGASALLGMAVMALGAGAGSAVAAEVYDRHQRGEDY
jgi:hypothetical protein